MAAEGHHYTYTWEWAGVPIIRLPDDVVVLQELIWSYRPTHIVETGVARGGSMVLNTSLQSDGRRRAPGAGHRHPDLPHTRAALDDHPLADGRHLHEGDSTDDVADGDDRAFLEGAERALLILDSNHTHDHVLGRAARAGSAPAGGQLRPRGRHPGRGVPRGTSRTVPGAAATTR